MVGGGEDNPVTEKWLLAIGFHILFIIRNFAYQINDLCQIDVISLADAEKA